MDIDVLYKLGETIVAAVLAQDTTEYIVKLHPSCELVETLPSGTDGTTKRLVSNGPVATAERARHLFRWLQSGSLCQPVATVDLVRVARKGRQDGPSPARSAKDIRSASSVTVTWGRYALRFEDRCYVFEDGLIGAIDRTLLLPNGPLADDPSYIADRNALLREGQSRVNAAFVRPPVLDYSFCDLVDVIDALRIAPRAGKKHRRAVVFVPKVEAKDSDRNAMYAGEDRKKTVIIRAKNRKGEEEAYEFQPTEPGAANAEAAQAKKNGPGEPAMVGMELIASLAKSMGSKYTADSVRFANNAIANIDHIVPVLRTLCTDAVLALAWIDLSCNAIEHVPKELGALVHLSTLYLHSNRISEWDVVRALRSSLHTLHSLTLFGNPIATRSNDYRQMCLSIMQPRDGEGSPLKSLDFVVVSECDRHVTAMFEHFHPTQEKKVQSARAVKERTVRLQATFRDF